MTKRGFLLGLAMLAGAAAPDAVAQQPQAPLRLVMNNELQVLDPVVTPSVVTRAFASMVWDTLAAPDSQGVMRPQMLQGWEVSADRLTWSFTLRPGLEWSDGAPVTAEDCLASIRRWGARDGLGRQLLAATSAMEATGTNSFVLRLNRPFALVMEALGKTATLVPYMMPARLAATPPGTQVTEIIGSGPFLFRREEWRPGDRVVFARNPRYRPRPEPADGLAGGKVVHFERAEFVSIPDHSTKVSALLQGEIDYIERAPLDFIESLRRDRRVVVTKGLGASEIFGALTLNQAQPPFNDVRMRRALQYAIQQPDVVAATGLPDDMVHQRCFTIYMCDTPYASDAGTGPLRDASPERARALLREAGYNNEPIVVLHARDSALIDPIALVAVDQMRRIGLNIDLQTTDWSTVAQRRTSRTGWHVVPLVWNGFDMPEPMVNPALVYNCANVYPGWWCDERQVPLLRAYSEEPDPAKRRALAAQLQALAHENVNVVPLGQFASPAVYRAELKGVIDAGYPVLWNIRREGR
ncbi:ABC transporter substrate-binding protein [Siccirubricoccus phaeus]|uniref:ABC transporter substrate-binding protein n=1 Tax=Siccirubricoccus phaeus TaxID=2595053 RepID=UPI00165B8866|nr:ABC transporter substrate-binding protein [Siccirubricoccus phaeus]